jgi:peptidoglycan/LPS O-acetylase OafA/YrhL
VTIVAPQAVRRFGDHRNAFGFLRLLLASLVIVSHTPQLVDGDRTREPLTQLFPSITFGDLAVDGFFIISGFLITGSYLSSKGVVEYLRKRVARIYPGFIVSSLVCVLLIGPATGAYFAKGPVWGFGSTVGHITLLLPPGMTNVFAGTPYRVLNGSAWTIQYEFACYLLVLLLGRVGLLRSWHFVAATSLVCLLLFGFAPGLAGDPLNRLPLHNVILLGDRSAILRLGGLFLAGGAFYLAQDRVPLKKHFLAAAFVFLCLTLLDARFAALGLGIFGSYVLLAVAALGSGTILAKINNRNDISYGVYLYAWPIEKTLLWFGFSTNLLALGFATFFLAAVAGTISWFLIEKPAMRFGRSSAAPKQSRVAAQA